MKRQLATDKANSTPSRRKINTASATDRSTYGVYLPQVREYRKHMAGMVSAGRNEMSKATNHICQRIDETQYRISWVNPSGKPASRVVGADGAVRFCERHNVTIFPPTGAKTP